MSEAFICPPPSPRSLHPESPLAVGFGMVIVEKDGEHVWSGDNEYMFVSDVEGWVANARDSKWSIEYYGPLSGSTYEWNGKAFVLTETNRGFA